MSGSRIRVLGGGWYGCHIAAALIDAGHEVELHEAGDRLFSGASGGNPARLHLGFHYPRSRLTRAACQEHQAEFMARYGVLTRAVPVNIYAVAAERSLIDFGTYLQLLRGELELIEINPGEFGLQNVEGAVLTGERHVVVDKARDYFSDRLDGVAVFGVIADYNPPGLYDWTIDCTFCARQAVAVDRYEPCVVGLLEGPTDRAVTIMDGPFPSVYPWNERAGLSSLSSAELTPLSKTCRSYEEARAQLDAATATECTDRCWAMIEQMAAFWPAVRDYRLRDIKRSIRAMPRSAADARLVDVVAGGDRVITIRAGKIDAVFRAERLVMEALAA